MERREIPFDEWKGHPKGSRSLFRRPLVTRILALSVIVVLVLLGTIASAGTLSATLRSSRRERVVSAEMIGALNGPQAALSPTARVLSRELLAHIHAHQFTPILDVHYAADYNVSEIRDPGEPIAPGRGLFEYLKPASELGVPYLTLSYRPHVNFFPSFITDVEADNLIKAAETQMQRSLVANHVGSNDLSGVSEIRTSTQAWLPHNHPAASKVVERICAVTGFDCGLAEHVMVLRYQPGQRYVSHLDSFDPRFYGPQNTNRAATFYIYLTSIPAGFGGETTFPRADGKPHEPDATRCDKGLRVFPHRGSAALFYDMHRDGTLDDHAQHGGCPPIAPHIKWSAVVWLRVALPGDQVASPGHHAPALAPHEE